MILKKGTKFYCPICGLEIEVTKSADTRDGYAFFCCGERMKDADENLQTDPH